MKKALGYVYNSCELITIELMQEIAKARQNHEVIGLGIETDEFFLGKHGRNPLTNFEDRMAIAKSISGVDFVFKIDDEEDYEPQSYTVPEKKQIPSKVYGVAYAPGTYDLFHRGHLEHLMEVKSMCDILVVGVNSDELVFTNKQKHTKLSASDRIAVVKNLRFVDYVFEVTTNEKKIANDWVKQNVGRPINVIVVGSDLKGQDFQNSEGIPILFTERDPELMKVRCSTYFREELKKLQS